jgi:hypothetical protein
LSTVNFELVAGSLPAAFYADNSVSSCFILRCFTLCYITFKWRGACVRRGVCAVVHSQVFTVAILAQGTNRGDALCAALLFTHVVSNLSLYSFFQVLICK